MIFAEGGGGAAAPRQRGQRVLATAQKNLRHEFARLTELYDKGRTEFYTWKHGYPRFLVHALWLGVGEDDTIVPMRADFEAAAVPHHQHAPPPMMNSAR